MLIRQAERATTEEHDRQKRQAERARTEQQDRQMRQAERATTRIADTHLETAAGTQGQGTGWKQLAQEMKHTDKQNNRSSSNSLQTTPAGDCL